jgi:hypothetical protein
MLKEGFACHPDERSEGSHAYEKARFFASIRMTIKVKKFMTHPTRIPAPTLAGLSPGVVAGGVEFAQNFDALRQTALWRFP